MLAILRGVLAAAVILFVGQIPLGLFVRMNLKWSPSIPWFLPTTVGTLWLFFRYLNGHGWPPSTSEERRHLLRGRALPARIWFWSLIAGAIGMTSAMCLAFIATRITRLSQRFLDAPVDFSNLPFPTALAVLGAIALQPALLKRSPFAAT